MNWLMIAAYLSAAVAYADRVRVADCDTPGCADRMHGRDDEELFRSIRRHVDTVHPDDIYTDDQLREWMATAAYTVDDRDRDDQ